MSFWFARTKKKSTGRFHEENQIPEKTLRGNVFSIGRRQSLGLGHIQAENLGPASDAGLGFQNASFSPCLNQPLLARKARSRAHQAHFTLQDIPYLGKLIQFEPAQDPADGRHRRPVNLMRGFSRRSFPHGPDLVAPEYLASLPDAMLRENAGTF
jgi:hypothetical protein